MQEISHKKARSYILADADGMLGENERQVLHGHLAPCPACRAYAAHLEHLHQQIDRSLHNRWDRARSPTFTKIHPADTQAIVSKVKRGLFMKQMKRLTGYAAGLVVIGLLVLAGMGLWNKFRANQTIVTPAIATAEAKTTLTLAVDEDNLAGYQPLIDLFEAQNTDIQVKLVTTKDIAGDKVDDIATLAAGADVFPYYPDVQSSNEYLLDLEPYRKLDATFQAEDFLPGLLENDGSLWSLPVSASYPVIFFDKSAFDKAGLAYPQAGWKADEFLTDAQALTARDGDTVTRWGFVPFYVQPFLSMQLTAPLMSNGKPRFTDPDVVAALTWAADLFTKTKVSPWLDILRPIGERTGKGLDPQELIQAGQAAMWLRGHVAWQFVSGQQDTGVTSVPRIGDGYAIEPIRNALAVSRGSGQPQAAWNLVSFLSQQPPARGTVSLYIPARKSVAAASGYWEQLPEPLAATLHYETEQNQSAHNAILLLPALTDIVEGNSTAASALAQLQAEMTGQIAEAQTTAAAPLLVATPVAPSESTQITFDTTWNETDAQQGLAKSFHQDHPDITVIVRRIDPAKDYFQEISNADCFAGSAVKAHLSDYVRPIDPILELDPSLKAEDFFPGAIQSLKQDGQLLGLPGWIYAALFQYNRGLFTAAGVPEPANSWTLADFLQTAQTLTDPKTNQYGFMDWSQKSATSFGPGQFGVTLLDRSGSVADIDFSAAEAMAGWYVDLVARYKVQPALPGDLEIWSNYFDRWDTFSELVQSGKVAMWPYMLDTELSDRLAGKVETGYAPVPTGPSGFSFSIPDNLTGYFIAKDTPHPEGCWAWIEYLAMQPTAAIYAGSSSGLPAYMPAARSKQFADAVGKELADAMLASMPNGSGGPANPAMAEDWLEPGSVWLMAAIEKASRDETDIHSALANAGQQFAQYRACVIDRQAFADAAAWEACAVQVDPELEKRYNQSNP